MKKIISGSNSKIVRLKGKLTVPDLRAGKTRKLSVDLFIHDGASFLAFKQLLEKPDDYNSYMCLASRIPANGLCVNGTDIIKPNDLFAKAFGLVNQSNLNPEIKFFLLACIMTNMAILLSQDEQIVLGNQKVNKQDLAMCAMKLCPDYSLPYRVLADSLEPGQRVFDRVGKKELYIQAYTAKIAQELIIPANDIDVKNPSASNLTKTGLVDYYEDLFKKIKANLGPNEHVQETVGMASITWLCRAAHFIFTDYGTYPQFLDSEPNTISIVKQLKDGSQTVKRYPHN